MGATEFAPEICKRYQTNELAVDSTEFGTRVSEGAQQLAPSNSLIFNFRHLGHKPGPVRGQNRGKVRQPMHYQSLTDGRFRLRLRIL